MYGNAYELMLHLSLIANDLYFWLLQLQQQHSPLSAALNITDQKHCYKMTLREAKLLHTRDDEAKQLTATRVSTRDDHDTSAAATYSPK